MHDITAFRRRALRNGFILPYRQVGTCRRRGHAGDACACATRTALCFFHYRAAFGRPESLITTPALIQNRVCLVSMDQVQQCRLHHATPCSPYTNYSCVCAQRNLLRGIIGRQFRVLQQNCFAAAGDSTRRGGHITVDARGDDIGAGAIQEGFDADMARRCAARPCRGHETLHADARILRCHAATAFRCRHFSRR